MATGFSNQRPSWTRIRARREFLLSLYQTLARWGFLRPPRGHYYSPLPSQKQLRHDGPRIFDRSLRDLPGVSLHEAEQVELLHTFARFYDEQPFPDTPQDGIRYFFDNYYYAQTDALVLYSILRAFRPKRVIEVGSGFSSAVMLDTNERFLDRSVTFTFIEPDSARLCSLLDPADYDAVDIMEQRVQDVDPRIVDRLTDGDILFVDSSHVSKAGSDVNHIVFELLPRLAPGVLVHFHDVLYPFEYPQDWFELGFAWNESYLLRSFLQFNSQFRIRFWNDFMRTFHAEDIRTLMPHALSRPAFGVNGSLWLQRT